MSSHVETSRNMAPADTDLVHDAERLLRSLAGVTHARVRSGPRGIDSVHVTAESDRHARDLARLVRSALLAGLAAPVSPQRVHVTVADDTDPHADADTRDDAPDHAAAQGRPSRIRLIHQSTSDEPADTDDEPPRDTARETARETAPSRADAPRLVAVDIDRTSDGRVVCRVSVTLHLDVHRAEATAVDLPGAAAQAAAQAAVRALVDAGLAGLELGGLREVEIAGRDYVIVALKHGPRHRSGSAPVIGSAERSAAEATVAAAREMT